MLRWGPNQVPVPYAAAWSAETAAVRSLIVRPHGGGLAYRDETPADRDRHGVLWERLRHAPGVGKPDFRALHSVRQRHALLHKLCQVCRGPADRSSRGWLFLLPRPPAAHRAADWPEGLLGVVTLLLLRPRTVPEDEPAQPAAA
jgi:hypothetical protein